MPDFTYAAIDQQGKTIRGHLDVADQVRAIERLKETGLFPTYRGPNGRRCDTNRATDSTE
jgi:type II secretory pathway component PulF